MQPATDTPAAASAAGGQAGGRGRRALRELAGEAARTAWVLFRVMLPAAAAARLLTQLGWTEPIGRALAPVMSSVGLPGATGLAWAAAMTTNIYAGLAVFLELSTTTPHTVAQTTVLMVLILEAHTLPVEALVARQAGARLRFTLPWRIGGGLLLAALLNVVYGSFGLLQGPNTARLLPQAAPAGWAHWCLAQARSMALIFLIILALLALLRLLRHIGAADRLADLLAPTLRLLGMGREAATLTVIGMVLGLGYGGGLIVHEARTGEVRPRDAFLAVSLLGLAHSLLEDTLLVAAVGAHVSGILLGRFAFAFAAVALLARAVRRWPAFERAVVVQGVFVRRAAMSGTGSARKRKSDCS